MNKKIFGVLIIASFLYNDIVCSQDYFGYSNFGGITSAIYNPANIAASRYKFNLNLISTNFYVGSNMYELNSKKFFNFDFSNLQEGTDYNKINDGGAKRFSANVDFVGPSLLFNLNKKTSIGITTRVRTLMNFDNLSNSSFNLLTTGNTDFYNQNFTESNVSYNIHSFADLGVTFAKEIYKTNTHQLKVGVTLKYVKGIGGGSVYINHLDVLNLKNADTISKIYGNFNVGYSRNIEDIVNGNMSSGLSQLGSSSGNSGIATDIGVVYQYRNHKKYPYKWRIGLSITDICVSAINYSNGTQGGNYIINKNNFTNIATSVTTQQNGETFDQYLHRLEDQSLISVTHNDSAAPFNMNLPTALHLNMDLHLIKSLYLNTYLLINLAGTNQLYTNYYTSTYIASPRFDKKWFSLLMPFSYNSLNEFNWGLGLRFGPLFLGSGSLFSNLTKDKVHNTDLKLSLAIPFYRSYKSTQQ